MSRYAVVRRKLAFVRNRCKADQKITVNKPLLKIRSLGFFVKKCLALSVPHQF